jgi:hypothetical protein
MRSLENSEAAKAVRIVSIRADVSVLKASTKWAMKLSLPDAISNRNSGGDQVSWDERPDCVVTILDGGEEVMN